jgi:hypothetical protein
MKNVEEKIINEGLSFEEHTLLEYRKAVFAAFFTGEQLKVKYGMIPPKFVFKGEVLGCAGHEFNGRVGLEVNGNFIERSS